MAVLQSGLTPKNLMGLFKGRIDRVMLYSRGKAISQQIKRGEFELITRAEAHISGSARMGFFNMMENFTVPWAVVFFEEGGPSKNTARDSLLLTKELQKLGFRGVRREKTMKKGENYNVWLFFEPAVPAKKLRFFMFTLYEKLGFPKETPIIPTTDTLPPGDMGHFVWLPYFNGVDKWLDENNDPYEALGIKQDCTIFIDENGGVIDRDFWVVPRISERDLDQALAALTGTVGTKYLPGVGLIIDETTVKATLNGCKAFQNIINSIENESKVSEEGIVRLAVLLRALGHDKLLKYYTDKLPAHNEKKMERAIITYTGPIFPDCLNMKQIDYCPPDQNCFSKTAPLGEYLGFWKEDKKKEKTLEPSAAGWYFKAVSEKADAQPSTSEDEETEGVSFDEDGFPILDDTGMSIPRRAKAPMAMAMTSAPPAPVISVEVNSIGSFMDELTTELEKQRQDFSSGKKLAGLSSGFDIFNEIIDGFNPGILYVITGDPGVGKSSFAKQVFDQILDKEKPNGLFITYNLSRRQLQCKTIARMAGINFRQLIRGDLPDTDWQKAARVAKFLKDKTGERSFIYEADENLPVSGIEKAIEKSGAGFVVIDNLQAIPAPGRNNAFEVQPPTAANLSMLKRISRKKGIPVIVISNGATTPEVQFNADVIINLTARVPQQIASSDKQPYIVMLSVEKNIEGISKTNIQYTFFPPRMTFYGEKKVETKPAGT